MINGKMRAGILLSANLLISAAALCGCGLNDKAVTYKSGGTTQTFAEGREALTADFPLPVYPNSKTTGSVSAEDNADAERSKFLMLSSQDPLEKVSSYYQGQLESSGWSLGKPEKSDSLVNLSATKADMEANVMLSSEGNKTTISLSVSKRSKSEPQAPGATGDQPNQLTPPTD